MCPVYDGTDEFPEPTESVDMVFHAMYLSVLEHSSATIDSRVCTTA